MKFEFSGSLYRFTDYNREVPMQGGTLGECLDNLVQEFPALATTMMDTEGQVSGTHRLFLNGEQLQSTSPVDLRATVMGESDVVYVLTAITGG